LFFVVMKKILMVISLFCFVFLTACSSNPKQITNNSAIIERNLDSNFIGKPTVFLWWATYCSHCREAIPVFEEKVYNIYQNEVNFLLNNVGNTGFNVKIDEDFSKKYLFDDFSETKCDYIPSWIIFDKNWDVILKSCGGEKDLNDITSMLEKIL